MFVSLVKRCINMCFDAVNFNTDPTEIQIKLPEATDLNALNNLAQGWSSILAAYGLMTHNLGYLDGRLPRTEAPSVSNQADYFSEHYMCH